jgi:uncharacterized protein HemX
VDLLGAELLTAVNLAAEREDTIVGLEEEIEMLRKPNAKEVKLTKEIMNLKEELTACHETISQLEEQLEAKDQEKQHWQREYDNVSLYHEDWLAAQRLCTFRIAEETDAEVSKLRSRTIKQSREIASLGQHGKISENELMRHEDSLVHKHKVTEGLLEDKHSLLKDVANCEETNVSNK